MTASEARRLATHNRGQIQNMEDAVRKAVRDGETSVRLTGYALPDTITHFRNLGYDIENETQNQNGNGCVIIWAGK